MTWLSSHLNDSGWSIGSELLARSLGVAEPLVAETFSRVPVRALVVTPIRISKAMFGHERTKAAATILWTVVMACLVGCKENRMQEKKKKEKKI